MNVSQRDRKALMLLGGAVAVWLVLNYVLPKPSSDAAAGATASPDSIPIAEKRLARYRQIAASVPGEEELLKKMNAELAEREKTLIEAQTGQQAQAHLLEILRVLAHQEAPSADLKNLELGQIRPFGGDYGEVLASASLECRIEELLNLMAALTAQKEAVAVSELRVNSASNKQKTVGVRLTVSGIVPRRLIPEKKGLAAF